MNGELIDNGLYIYNTLSTESKLLISDTKYSSGNWFPDGTKIAYIG